MTAPPREQRTLISTRREYLQGVDLLFGLLQQELRIFDPDLSDLKLEAPARIENLRMFLSRNPANTVRIAVHDAEYIKRHCPRLMRLLGSYASRLAIHRTLGGAAKVQDCFVLADRVHILRRPVAKQGRGVIILDDAKDGQTMHERFSEIWEFSESGASASTSGL